MPAFVLLIQRHMFTEPGQPETTLALAGGPFNDYEEAKGKLPRIKAGITDFRNGTDNIGLIIIEGEMTPWNDIE